MATKNRIKLKGKLVTYLKVLMYLGIMLLVVNLAVFIADESAGLILLIFTGFYFVSVMYLNFYNKPIIMNELISFATQYGQIQKRLLKDLDLAHAVLDDSGKVVWANTAFEKAVHMEKGIHKKTIFSFFPGLSADKFPEGNEEASYKVDFENSNYTIKFKRISLAVKGEDTLLIVFGADDIMYDHCNTIEMMDMINTIIKEQVKKDIQVEMTQMKPNQNDNYFQMITSKINLDVEEEDF